MFRALKVLLCFLLSAAVVLFFAFLGSRPPVFPEGENYTFCVGSSSSQAKMIVTNGNARILRFLLSDVRGESTVYMDKDCSELLAFYEAVPVFTEACAGVRNEYYYSPCFSGGVWIEGALINLHVAYRENTVCIGTPVIFGGY